ncbi:MAG: hypothetical protein Kow00129_06820 [Thermoleophilia bacterium]
MAKGKGYTLVPQSVPSRQRSSFYQQIIKEFREKGVKSALVEGTDKKPVTLVQGLRKAIEAEGYDDISVVQRGTETYLVREE